MEIRTKLNDSERDCLLELGNGILSDGLRVAIGMSGAVKTMFPELYEHSIKQAQTLRGAADRDRARAAAASRYRKTAELA